MVGFWIQRPSLLWDVWVWSFWVKHLNSWLYFIIKIIIWRSCNRGTFGTEKKSSEQKNTFENIKFHQKRFSYRKLKHTLIIFMLFGSFYNFVIWSQCCFWLLCNVGKIFFTILHLNLLYFACHLISKLFF